MSESNAYTSFRVNVTAPGDRLDRIENLAGLGFPDTNGCFNGKEFWMEIKAPEEPKKVSTPLFGSNHRLSIEQRNWFLRQTKARGRGFVYIETNACRLLIDGLHADIVNTATLEQLKAIAAWRAPKPTQREEWAKLRRVIVNS